MGQINPQTENTENSERAVSPVIGVILMVAITVILAAVIAAFVLDIGQSQDTEVQAGATIENDGTSEVTITWTSGGTADHLEIRGENVAVDAISSDGDAYLSSVGSSTTLTQTDSGDNFDVNGDGTNETQIVAGDYSVVAVGSDGSATTINTFEVTT